jgi:hypothetical protein
LWWERWVDLPASSSLPCVLILRSSARTPRSSSAFPEAAPYSFRPCVSHSQSRLSGIFTSESMARSRRSVLRPEYPADARHSLRGPVGHRAAALSADLQEHIPPTAFPEEHLPYVGDMISIMSPSKGRRAPLSPPVIPARRLGSAQAAESAGIRRVGSRCSLRGSRSPFNKSKLRVVRIPAVAGMTSVGKAVGSRRHRVR